MVKLILREAFMFFTMQTQNTMLKTKTNESTKKQKKQGGFQKCKWKRIILWPI